MHTFYYQVPDAAQTRHLINDCAPYTVKYEKSSAEDGML